MKKTLIFDNDGTIHNTLSVYEPAMRKAFSWLEEEGICKVPEVSTETIAGFLGMNVKEMWNSFLPEIPDSAKMRAADVAGYEIERLLLQHKGCWYDGMKETLDALKAEGFHMVVLSNCRTFQARAHWKAYGMERWFDHFYDCQTFDFIPKSEIIKKMEAELPGPYVVIGDSKSDFDCAKAVGAAFIGCTYGFGKMEDLEGADLLVDAPAEILTKGRKLLF